MNPAISVGKIIGIVAGLLGAVLIIALFMYNSGQKTDTQHLGDGKPWNANMVMGDVAAPNRMIDYTDYFCSYCGDVQRAAGEEFKKDFIDTKKLAFENRIVTILSEKSPNTEQGAEAAYCAADQKKYWEYTHHIMPRLKADYFDKGIGVNTVPVPVPIEKLPIEYFLVSARAVELDIQKFESCVTNETHKSEIAESTRRAIELGVTGLPYLVVNGHQSSGFAGGYDGLKAILEAGGV